MPKTVRIAAAVLVPAAALPAYAQGTLADYQRAMTLRDRYQDTPVNVADQARWIANTHKLWYRKSVAGGHEFVLVDAETRAKQPAFDHTRLAQALSTALKRTITPTDLPFTQFTFVDGLSTIEFQVGAGRGAPPAAAAGQAPPWRCTLADYKCGEYERAGRGGRGGRGGGGGLAGPVRPPFEINGGEPKKSPDGKLEALVNNYNVAIREVGKRDVTLLSTDGSEGGYYDPDSLIWSPDSKKIAIYKVKPGHRRFVHYVQSSPEDQLQPKHSTMQYAKPGDVLDVESPVLFHVDTEEAAVRRQRAVPECLRRVAPGVAQGQHGRHLRIQPARSPALSRALDRRRHRRDARRDRRRSEDVLLLLGQAASARTSTTATRSSGCRSATAGITCISTTARPAR